MNTARKKSDQRFLNNIFLTMKIHTATDPGTQIIFSTIALPKYFILAICNSRLIANVSSISSNILGRLSTEQNNP